MQWLSKDWVRLSRPATQSRISSSRSPGTCRRWRIGPSNSRFGKPHARFQGLEYHQGEWGPKKCRWGGPGLPADRAAQPDLTGRPQRGALRSHRHIDEWHLNHANAFRHLAFQLAARLGEPGVVVAPPLLRPRLEPIRS